MKLAVVLAVVASLVMFGSAGYSGAGNGGETGGPVTIMGIDAEDGGVGGHGPISVYNDLVTGMFANVSNGNPGILVLGGGKNPADNVTTFWDEIGSDLGRSITYANGAAVGTQSLDGFGLVAIPSSVSETPGGGLTDAESELLTDRSLDFAQHVNTGGGLLVFSQTGQTTPYGFIADVAPITSEGIDSGDDTDVDITPAGTAAGLTDQLDVCCWHDQYTSFPSFLDVLATYGGSNEVAALGGANVLIPSGIELSPQTQQIEIGGTCTITATVTEDEEPVEDVEVTFEVTDGPESGTSATATTGADGTASFELTGTAVGTNVVVGSNIDSLEREREDTANCEVVEGEPEVLAEGVQPTPAPAPAPAEPAAPVEAQPAFTG